MPPGILLAAVLLIALLGYYLGRGRARALTTGTTGVALHSRPGYHGAMVALWCGLPSLILLMVWLFLEGALAESFLLSALGDKAAGLGKAELAQLVAEVRRIARGVQSADVTDPALLAVANDYAGSRRVAGGAAAALVLAVAVGGLFLARGKIVETFRARQEVERIFDYIMIAASVVAILTTLGIVLSLLFETLRFFAKVSPWDFFFGLHWSPQTALRADQVGASGSFGAIPLLAGTILITLIAMTVAVPIGLFSAIYLSEYAGPRFRAWVKPLLEILAGIPTVVYGFFAALTVAPFIRNLGGDIGLDVASESALAAGLVMGLMIIPFVSSLTDDVMNAVPQTLRDGAYALGATQSETIRQVVVPAAFPGIVGAVLLAVSRAIGETMIVVMAAGLAANLTVNPLEAVTTVTVQIVTLLVGDQEFDSAKTLAAFALGLTLFAVTLALNVVALRIVKKYREIYD